MERVLERVCFALCLCALIPLMCVNAQDYSEEDATILENVRQDESETQPEVGIDPSAQFLRSNKAAWRMPGQYLVVLKQGTHESHVQRTIRRLQARAARRGHPLEVVHTYSGRALRGFLVRMSSEVLDLAVKLPHVDYVEEDSSIFAQSMPWNLQRLMQGSSPDSGKYSPPNDGGGAEVFLMDGSVQSSHREIESRVLVTDFNSVPEEDGVRVHRQASQCDSHGTHTAGVVSGRDSGVARGAGVNVVRVLNCQGKGTVSGALAGLEFISVFLRSRPVDSVVVLLPFIGGLSRSLNAACREMVSGGAALIAAAGNYNDDACLYSPASEPEVITVGAVNSADQPISLGAGGTNVGRCVDLFAPGDDIISASSDCSTCFTSHSGTSQAAAHTAGIAAVMLSSNPNASSVELLQRMLRNAVPDAINPLSLPEGHRVTTPNAVAALPPPTAANHTEEALLCRSVWSERSGAAASDRAAVRCRHGEEMMGCASYAPEGGRLGETISEQGGQTECVAHSGHGGEGVYAVARCCVTSGLRCQAHASPRPGKDAECADSHHHLTGCSSLSATGAASDSRHRHGDRKRCVTTEGTTSGALCCHAPSLECRVVEQEPIRDHEQVALSCPSGWTLTDCRVTSRTSALLGHVVRGNACLARAAAAGAREEEAEVAMVTCCRVSPSQHSAGPEH